MSKKTFKSNLWKPDKDINWDIYSNEELLAYADKAKDVPEMPEYTIYNDSLKQEVPIKGTMAFQEYYQTEFDYSQLSNQLIKRGAKNGFYFDSSVIASPSDDVEVITLDHGKRNEKVEKKITLSKELSEMMEFLFCDSKGKKIVTPLEQSKILEQILLPVIKRLAEKKKNGKLKIQYAPVAGKTIM